MRLLPALIALSGACSFKAGSTSVSGQTDAPVEVSDSDNNLGDAEGPDVPVSPIKVRRIDVVDAQVSGSHTDFPMLISITDTWLKSVANGGDVQRNDGFDIHFS